MTSRQASEVSAMILAAGYSSRMERCKMLLPLGGRTALEEAIFRLRAAGIEDILVVTGHWRKRIIPVVERLDCRWTWNRNYDEGMYSSIRTGVSALPGNCRGFLLLPGDIPLVKPRTYRSLLKAHQEGNFLIYPAFLGQRGHPPLIGRQLFDSILKWRGDGGLRNLLSQFEDAAQNISTPDQSILMDMDTISDYKRLKDYLEKEYIPTEEECEALLDIAHTSDRIRRHSRAVAGRAILIGEALKRHEFDLDLELLERAGLLHDILREHPSHAEEGGRMLRDFGYERLARIVSLHMNLPEGDNRKIDETSILYLADKLTSDEALCDLRRRLDVMRTRFAGDPEAREGAERRLGRALEIQEEVEDILGKPILKILEEQP